MKSLSLTLKFTPREWQRKCMEEQTRFMVLALHRRAGKTTLAVAELLSAAFQKRGNYVYLSPQKNQAKTNMWDIIKDMLSDMIGRKINGTPIVEMRESDLSVRFHNGSRLWLAGAEDPDKIRGAKIQGAIIDEVAQMPRAIWEEVIRPTLMDTKGWALFIGTPKGINLFSELFDKGRARANNGEWSARRFTCYETDALPPAEIEAYRAEVDENTFKREMLCDFNASTEDQLLSLEEVSTAMTRVVSSSNLSIEAPLIMGVDVARYGNDRSSITFRRGLIAEKAKVITQADTTTLARIIAELANQRKPKIICIDGTGCGSGVVDTVIRMGFKGVYDINFSSIATDSKKYANIRAEMWFRMANWVRRGGVLPNDETLKQELCAPLYECDEGHRLKLESKKNIKQRLGFSPDVADSLALTFAIEVGTYEEEQVFENPFYFFNTVPKTPFQRYERRLQNVQYPMFKRNYDFR